MFTHRLTLSLLVLVACGCASNTDVASTTEAAKIYDRNEFNALVIGKSEEEVIQAVGKPDKTSDGPDYRFYEYFKRTKDGVSDKIDSNASIVFQNGMADRVNY